MGSYLIAHIDTHLTWRGGQRQVLELIKGLEKKGHRNLLICKKGSEIGNRAIDAKIETLFLPLLGEWDIYSVMKLRSAIYSKKIDILHTHTSHAHTVGVLSSLGKDRCKLVVSRRVDFHVKNPLSRFFKYGNTVDRFITVSEAVKNILIEDGIEPGRIISIHSGFVEPDVKGDSRNYRKELGLDGKFIILNVAALAPHKAQNVLVDAAAIVVEKHPDAVFIIAGEGELRNEIENAIKNKGIEKNFRLLGFMNDVYFLYKAADLFVMSSREEALCTSLLDAVYFNLPIVATNAGGISEIVGQYEKGELVPVDDSGSFADKIIGFIENPVKTRKDGCKSSCVLQDFTIANTVNKTAEVYDSLFI